MLYELASALALRLAPALTAAVVAVSLSCAGCADDDPDATAADAGADAGGDPDRDADNEPAPPRLPATHAGVPNAALGEQLGAPACGAIEGSGVRIGLWDVGHPRGDHRDLRGRVLERDLAPYSQHATHTTATSLGAGAGDPLARGLAPRARAWAFDAALDVSELAGSAAALSVSSHPYGPVLGWSRNPACPERLTFWGRAEPQDETMGRYAQLASVVDRVARDSDLLMVWAAGNERLDAGAAPGELHYHAGSCERVHDDLHVAERTRFHGTLGGAAVAKNALTVGAVHQVPHAYLQREHIVPLDISSAGPARDGRIKPELCAGGETVRSASDADATSYAILNGSSSATAAVAGAAALLAEAYREQHDGADPRAAELKALMIQTARDAGVRGPDALTGFGLLDVEAALALLAETRAADGGARLQLALVRAGEAIELETPKLAAGTSIRVTAAWIDPPAAPAATVDAAQPALVNDLDLELRAPAGEPAFLPWTLAADRPSAPAARDHHNRVDPVEVVEVDAADNRDPGPWRARIAAVGALRRDAPQVVAIASSVPLRASTPRSLLTAPRYVDVEHAIGQEPGVARIRVGTTDGARRPIRVRALDPWLDVDAGDGAAPGVIEVVIDAAAVAQPGERLARIAIEASDGDGADPDARVVGVVVRTACEPACAERECGADARCGGSCGQCSLGEGCADGRCRALEAGCPAADLGEALGAGLVRVLQGAGDSAASGRCGGDRAPETAVTWRAPGDGRYAFTTFGSQVDTVMYARDGGCDGEELACNDDAHGAASAIELPLRAGQRVSLWLDGYDSQGRGEVTLAIDRAVCPSTQLGAQLGRQLVRVPAGQGIDHVRSSCGGAGDEEGADVTLGWTAPSTSRYRFALRGTAGGGALAVRNRDCDGDELACTAADDEGEVALELDVARDQALAIAIEGSAANSIEMTLDIEDLAQSCGDACNGTPSGCACDEACVAEGNCCADACARCGHCACEPRCEGRACGDDGCGGQCGDCDLEQSCVSGQCVTSDCGQCPQCSECPGATCAALLEGAPCEDGNLCTVTDSCRDGVCVGEPRACDDGFACTNDRCDPSSGGCMTQPQEQTCELIEPMLLCARE